MKITIKENSPNRLNLILRPNGVFLIGAGILLVLSGLFVIWILGDQVRLTVSNGKVHYRKVFLGLDTRKEFTVSAESINSVTLELKEGLSPTYKVTLMTADESYQADLPLSDGDEKRGIVDQLTEQIPLTDGRFELEQSGVIGAVFLGGICIIGGLVCLYFLQNVTINADARSGIAQIRRRRSFFPVVYSQEFELKNYWKTKIKGFPVTNRAGVTSISYQVQIQLHDEKLLNIANGPMFTKRSARELTKLLKIWMAKKPIEGVTLEWN